MTSAPRSARERMSPEQLLAAIDELAGGNQSAFARLIGVEGRTVRYWVAGSARIPQPVQRLIRTWLAMDQEQRAALRRPQ